MDPEGLQVAKLIDRAYHGINRAVVRGLAARGFPDLRASHAVVFELVGGGARVSDMAAQAGMSKQGMAQLVAHLEASGYLQRTPDPADGRAQVVTLTARGRRSVEAATEVGREVYSPWVEVLGPHRLTELRRALQRVVDGVESGDE